MPPSRASGLTARARRLAARASVVALGTVLVGLLAPVLPAAAAEPDYPSYDSRYHTNAEMVAEIHAAEAAYPDLVDVMSIGKSYRGRDIWVAKISDNVAIDEAEPEVMVDALHHARERLSLEQALYLLKTLTGSTPRIPGSARSWTPGRSGSSSPSIPTGMSTTWAATRIACGARTASPPPAPGTSAPT